MPIDAVSDMLPQVAEDTAALRAMVEGFLSSAIEEGRVEELELEAEDKENEIVHLTEELRGLQGDND